MPMNAMGAAKRTIEEQTGTNLRTLADAELARRALTNDDDAWRELVRRFSPVLRDEIGKTLGGNKKLLCSDSVDEVMGEYWLALLANDREWLRRFNAKRTKLATWLCVLAWSVTTHHLRLLRRWRAGTPMDGLDLEREPWQNRGARFIAAMRAIEDDEPVRIDRFKWR
jgi:hypothetical protein